jgi:hypothetical protein
MSKNVLAYATLGVLTAPIWIPLAFVGYLGYKASKFAFANPKTAAAGIALAGLTWYAGCQNTVNTVTTSAQKVVETYRSYQTSQLEQKLESERVTRIAAETKAQEYRQLAQQYARPASTTPPVPTKQAERPPENVSKTVSESPRTVQVVTDPDFAFYFMKTGDTLDRVAAKIGTPSAASLIAQDNGIADSRKVLAGQLLKIRRQSITRTNPDVYEQIPILRSSVVPGNMSISQACQYNQECMTNVFTVSRQLGLNYTDEFPYKQGARVVYYR